MMRSKSELRATSLFNEHSKMCFITREVVASLQILIMRELAKKINPKSEWLKNKYNKIAFTILK